MKFTPLGDRLLVKLIETETETPSGIILPDTAKEKPQTAEVIEIGDETLEELADSRHRKPDKGDVIVFAKYSGTEINLEGEEYIILDADDALGIVDD